MADLLQIKIKTEVADSCPSRRRGRPSGKNRQPLSVEERRARNARYERERRQETSEALADLAEAAGCEPSISNTEILATVLSQLQRAEALDPEDSIEELECMNKNLLQQVILLEKRLLECNENQNDENQEPKPKDEIERKRKKNNRKSDKKSIKRIKITSQNFTENSD